MNTATLTPATPGVQDASAPVCRGPEAGVINRPAGPTIIARTSTGLHELQTIYLACTVAGCPHPATVVIGSVGFRQGVDDWRRVSGQFCMVHGMERLGALDPARFGVAS